MSTDQIAQELRVAIESLGNGRSCGSDQATTPRGTSHTEIVNGKIRKEGDEYPPLRALFAMAMESIVSAAELRRKVAGDAYVVWRVLPEIGETGDIYMRLCFEPV